VNLTAFFHSAAEFPENVAQKRTCEIQYQVINVAASQKAEKLQRLHCHDQHRYTKQRNQNSALLLPDVREEEAQWYEHDHIAHQINKRMAQKIRILTVFQELPVQPYGLQGFQIDISRKLGFIVCVADSPVQPLSEQEP